MRTSQNRERVLSPIPSAALATLLLLFVGTGCTSWAHTSSPWEFGGGVRPAPALWEVGDEGATGHAVLGYTYLSWRDGDGHDALWEAGGQVRKPTQVFGEHERQPWIGVEGTASVLRSIYSVGAEDFSDESYGFSATALAGMPFSDSRWGPHVYAGAGLSYYGAVGINVRVGIDLQPWFLPN